MTKTFEALQRSEHRVRFTYNIHTYKLEHLPPPKAKKYSHPAHIIHHRAPSQPHPPPPHVGLNFPEDLSLARSLHPHPPLPPPLLSSSPMYVVLHHCHRHPPFRAMTEPGERVWGGGGGGGSEEGRDGGGVREEGGRGKKRRACPVCTEKRIDSREQLRHWGSP